MLTDILIEQIEKTAPLAYAAKWDKSGIQVAAPVREIKNMAVMLDPTLSGIRAALEQNADFILTHHPLALAPRFPDKIDEHRDILKILLQKDVLLYAAHTSLDANPKGPVRWLAQALELTGVQIAEKTGQDDTLETGFGFYGQLPQGLTREELSSRLKAAGIPNWRAVGRWPDKIHGVACCPGSGASLAPMAFSMGADVYITGDVKYHQALEIAPHGLTLDVGHFVLEEKMMSLWAQTLQRELQDQIHIFFVKGCDPFCHEKL